MCEGQGIVYLPHQLCDLESLLLYEPLLFHEQHEGRALITFKDHSRPRLTAGHHRFPYLPPEKETALLPSVICFSLMVPTIKNSLLYLVQAWPTDVSMSVDPNGLNKNTMVKGLLID